MRPSVLLILTIAPAMLCADTARLQLHRPVERELPAGESHVFNVAAKAGEFIQVKVEQLGVELVVSILDPEGRSIVIVEDLRGEFALKTANVIAQSKGRHHVKVTTAPDLRVSGKYRIELLALRNPTDQDRLRLRADALFRSANGGIHEGTKVSQNRALGELADANKTWRELKDRYQEALGLQKIGEIHDSLGDERRALDAYNEARRLYQEIGDRAGEASIIAAIGGVYRDTGQWQQGLEFLNQAFKVFHEIGARGAEAETLNNIGVFYSTRGDKPKALALYSQVLPVRRAMGDRAGEAVALSNIAAVYTTLGENQKALDHYNQALAIRRTLGDRQGESNILSNLGVLYANLGDRQRALEHYSQALAIRRVTGDRKGEAVTLANIGRIYDDLGQKQRALEYFLEALPLRRAVGDRDGEAVLLANLGKTYSDLGLKKRALESYNQALPILRAVGNRPAEAVTLSNMGGVFFSLGDLPKALEYFNQALPIRRAVGDRAGVGVTLSNIGRAYAGLGEPQKALECHNEALAIQRAVGDRAHEAIALNNIGRVYLDLGEKQKALEHFNLALPIFRAVGDRAGEAKTLDLLEGLFHRSQPDLAIAFGKQAINVLQSLRRDNRRLEEELRRSYEQSMESSYRSLADLLIERGRFGEAEEVLNLLKDKEASDFIRRDTISDKLRSATLLDFEQRALGRYDEIVGRIADMGQRKSALAAKSSLTTAESQESAQLDADLRSTNLVLNRYFEEQEKEFAAKSALSRRIVEVKDAQALAESLDALGPGVVAIYTVVMPDKYEALLVTSRTRKAYISAIREEELNQKIEAFRQQLQNPASDPRPLAQELYRVVFPAGLRDDLDTIHTTAIMWSVDGALRYIPFAALYDGKHYLVERFQQALFTPDLLKHIADAPQVQWTGLGFGVSEGSRPLPSVAQELRSIFKETTESAAPVPGVVRLNAAFTREAFENELRQKRPVVHIASHFDSAPGVAANSTLLLGDGAMSLAEIAASTRLFEGVDLLTLSACNTAFRNGYQDGREIDSFGTIAQRQGAKGVIASLWSVNDPSTAALMEAMYRMRQETPGITKGEALRQAQSAMLTGRLKPGAGRDDTRAMVPVRPAPQAKAGSDWSHPYYWGPFILLGNSR